MHIIIKQKGKRVYTASFEIIEDEKVVGTFSVDAESSKGAWIYTTGTFREKNFGLKCQGGLKRRKEPHDILENGNEVGKVSRNYVKKNIFSEYFYVKCNYNDKEYNEYAVALGDKNVYSIYLNDIQVGQIEKSALLHNDLHNYDIFCENDDNAYISILICCYIYVSAFFTCDFQGKSVSKTYGKTSNKELLKKYNPDWVKGLK